MTLKQIISYLLILIKVIKYADNILKGFATSIAIIVSCLASSYLFSTVIDTVFAFGTMLVVVSVMLYSYVPAPQSPQSTSQMSSLSSSPIKMNYPINVKSINSTSTDVMTMNELIQYKLINNNISSSSSSSSSSNSSVLNENLIEMNSK